MSWGMKRNKSVRCVVCLRFRPIHGIINIWGCVVCKETILEFMIQTHSLLSIPMFGSYINEQMVSKELVRYEFWDSED